MEPIYLSWSGGKESSMALYRLLHSPVWREKYQVVQLMTMVTDDFGRSSMHGIRRSLLQRQAESVGIDLLEVVIPVPCSNEKYDEIMSQTMMAAKEKGVQKVAFGDLFLEDIRDYREDRLASIDMEGLFPLWGEDTTKMAHEFIELGFKARLAAIDQKKGLVESFAGRIYDKALLSDLPEGIDPCAERGEFHTFVFDGPIFSEPVKHTVGELERREYYTYIDFLDEPQGEVEMGAAR